MIPIQIRKRAVQVVDTYDLTATQRAVVLHQAMASIKYDIERKADIRNVKWFIQSYIEHEYPEVTS